ncbi:MAG: NADH-quinone oxidoreductase subunit C [Gammaproteobacteria bacterium]
MAPTSITTLTQTLEQRFAATLLSLVVDCDEITLEIPPEQLLTVCQTLRDDPAFDFQLLVDVCGVDYLKYGLPEWETEQATYKGFSRAVNKQNPQPSADKPRFAVVYHLLSLNLNQRLRLRVLLEGESPTLQSIVPIWPAANWYEREAFDLFGIIFEGHPDLRRLLTDYGFIGHPFRKDFPTIGHVEMRYDATVGRCIYEPVSIQPRNLLPKVIRHDNRELMS